MKFKLTVIQVTRLLIETHADSAEQARARWINGRLLDRCVIEADVVDVRKVA